MREDKYREYEKRKQKLAKSNLNHKEYEKRLRKIIKKLGLWVV